MCVQILFKLTQEKQMQNKTTAKFKEQITLEGKHFYD